MSRVMKNSKGYSFVELIIVIAIIIVLSVMALVSMTIISSAKAKDAAINFGEEISTLKQRCMNMTPDRIDDSTGRPKGNYDKWALALYVTSEDKIAACLVKHVDSNTSSVALSGLKGRYVPVEYDADRGDVTGVTPDFTSTDFEDSDYNIVFSSRMDAYFDGTYNINNNANPWYTEIDVSSLPATLKNTDGRVRPSVQRDFGLDNNINPIYITFDKRGNCTSGVGNYYFYKKNGNYVARIEVQRNGSITIK